MKRLHPLHLLTAALAWNFVRGQRGLPTICSTCRQEINDITLILGWAALTSWFIPHYCRPFWEARKNGVT